jgi:outer membrane lipoprotein-sorting protein
MYLIAKRYLLFLFIVVFLIKCASSSNTEIELAQKLKEAELSKQNMEDSIKQVRISDSIQNVIRYNQKKYIYIEMRTKWLNPL